jgi:hypothetical protein
MKILFAECCGDLVVPDVCVPGRVRWCKCRLACCWWRNPYTGDFSCWSLRGDRFVSVLGINNALLTAEFTQIPPNNEMGVIQADRMAKMIEDTPASYLFKTLKSLIIRVRPGFSNDIVFENPP